MMTSEKINRQYCFAFVLMLFLQLMILDLNFIFKKFLGVSDTGVLTLIYYLILLIYVLKLIFSTYTTRTIGPKLAIYVLFLSFFGFFYYWFEDTRIYFGTNTTIVMAFCLPLCIFIVSEIRQLNDVFQLARPFTLFGTFLSLFLVLCFDTAEFGNYMEFSYAFLPFVFFAYHDFKGKHSPRNFFVLAAAIFLMMIFAARATVLFLLVFILLAEIFFSPEKSSARRIIFMCLLTLTVILFITQWTHLQRFLTQFAVRYNSRFLRKLLDNELFLSESRQYLASLSRQAISKMGWNMYGMFGDRLFLSGHYSHNIVYEALLTYGWILGSALLFALFWGTVKVFSRKNSFENKYCCVFFFFCLFAKFFISASFTENINFYLFAALLIPLNRKNRTPSFENNQPAMAEEVSHES